MSRTLADAIIAGDEQGVKQFIANGSDINAYDQYGYTPLAEACLMNRQRIAEYLLSLNPDIDKKDIMGCTPLYWAIDVNNIDLIRLLLQKGADPNAYSAASEPAISHAVLRKNEDIMDTMARFGADIRFAKDYINTKLLGHRFELSGFTSIVNASGEFIPLNFEGFFLEYTLGLICDSLEQYTQSAGTMRLGPEFIQELKEIIHALRNAEQLRAFNYRLVDAEKHKAEIEPLLHQKLLIIPVSYEGHAITFVRFGHYLARCNRGVDSNVEHTVNIYRITKPEHYTRSLLYQVMYHDNTKKFINFDLNEILGLEPVGELPTRSQVTGNCSWANVEASIPTALFMFLASKTDNPKEIPGLSKAAMQYYQDWKAWDKDQALETTLRDFDKASPARQAMLAVILGSILFQSLSVQKSKEVAQAKEIVKRLDNPRFQFVLDSYIQVYITHRRSEKDLAFKQLLLKAGLALDQYL